MSKVENKIAGIESSDLRDIIGRIEYFEAQKQELATELRDVYSEAKGRGFDVAILRQIIKLRKIDHDELVEQEALLDTYRRALGMLPELD